MLTRWLTFTAFLASSANPERAPANGRGTLTVAPTCRVKGHPEAELTLNCGDGKKAGVVQYWHTPFGDLQNPGFHSKLDPVFMHHDGSLNVPITSILHSGLYYCLLQHTEGTTLWPYELHVGHDNDQKNQEHSKGCDVFRFRRDVGSLEEKQAGVSDGQFAGAVAASVLLTFVVGFSAGALTRTPVLRCLGAVTTRLQSQRQQPRTTDSEVTMTTLPPVYNDQTWESDANSAHCSAMETTITPPTKPQRSIRQKPQEEQETTAYLEGCNYMKEKEEEEEETEEEEEEVEEEEKEETEEEEEETEEEEEVEEEEEGKSLKENNKGCDGEAKEGQISCFYLGEDGGSQTETDDNKCSNDGEEKDGRESREKKKEWRQEEDKVEEAGEQENRSMEDGEERRGKEEEEKGRDEEDEATDSNKQEDTMKNGLTEGGVGGETSPSPGRRSRVIRLYQYDEDGQRFGHLPSSATDEPGPVPRLKQRSLSLTRLNAIMAAASAGPLDTRETGRGEREERPHFHMEI